MSRIKSKNTSIEVMIRSMLQKKGLRFRKHSSKLPGKPDIVLTSFRLAVFIDGDFWHGYRFNKWKGKLTPFWREKIASNMKRDQRNFRSLRRQGWKVVRIWERQIKRDPESVVAKIIHKARA